MNMLTSKPIVVHRNGLTFLAHPFRRYDPSALGAGEGASILATGISTGFEVQNELAQGELAEDLAKERAAIDIRTADAIREAADEEARVKAGEGRRLLATQKSQAAAGGVRINVGAPLVIEAETRAAIARDISFGLKRGRQEESLALSSAIEERATGAAIRRRSRFDAISSGLQGAGTIADMAKEAGLFSKKKLNPSGTFKKKTGIGQKKFGRMFISTT